MEISSEKRPDGFDLRASGCRNVILRPGIGLIYAQLGLRYSSISAYNGEYNLRFATLSAHNPYGRASFQHVVFWIFYLMLLFIFSRRGV